MTFDPTTEVPDILVRREYQALLLKHEALLKLHNRLVEELTVERAEANQLRYIITGSCL